MGIGARGRSRGSHPGMVIRESGLSGSRITIRNIRAAGESTAGIPAMATIQAAASVAADPIGDPQDIGSVQPGRYADLVATDGDPLGDITEMQRIRFVMQGGRIVKGVGATPP